LPTTGPTVEADVQQGPGTVPTPVILENNDIDEKISESKSKNFLGVGLNYVNPDYYEGWNGALGGCVADITNMKNILIHECKFDYVVTYLNEQATVKAVISKLLQFAEQLVEGDLLVFHYSGHGGQFVDVKDTYETDGMSETMVLYDGEVIDNWFWNILCKFKPGVRVLHLSDSCHSGTLYRVATNAEYDLLMGLKEKGQKPKYKESKLFTYPPQQTMDWIPEDILIYNSESNDRIKCHLKEIGGCQDNQYSMDLGAAGGLFTTKLIATIEDKGFLPIKDVYKELVKKMPNYQTPSYNEFNVGSSFDTVPIFN